MICGKNEKLIEGNGSIGYRIGENNKPPVYNCTYNSIYAINKYRNTVPVSTSIIPIYIHHHHRNRHRGIGLTRGTSEWFNSLDPKVFHNNYLFLCGQYYASRYSIQRNAHHRIIRPSLLSGQSCLLLFTGLPIAFRYIDN